MSVSPKRGGKDLYPVATTPMHPYDHDQKRSLVIHKVATT